jgi:Bacterial regulatory proteins, luxR family
LIDLLPCWTEPFVRFRNGPVPLTHDFESFGRVTGSGCAQGHPNKVIAYDRGINQRTVEVHRARMMERLAVRQFAEAIRLAALAGLAEGK